VNFQIKGPNFEFSGGELCLDFANTADWHASPKPQENLNSYSDLLVWGQMAGVLSDAEVQQLWQSAQTDPAKAQTALTRAIDLREAIYRIFVRLVDQETPSQSDLDILNYALQRALPHLRVEPSAEGFSFEWEVGDQDLERVLWPVVWSAADLLTSEDLDRVGQCADDRGCGYLFFDTSRNHSRRWCSMESCGNRAKAMRHYQRQIS
jgi:predicted RNA-binding Zn ribbon-like protein